MLGQINRNNFLGNLIYEYASRPDIINIVDIGTWNGYGSTKCIIDAFIDTKKNNKFMSIEANKEQFLQAQNNLSTYTQYVNLVYGTIAGVDDLISIESIEESNRFFRLYSKSLQLQWRQHSVSELSQAPDVTYLIPSTIDLLILDGGEYSTYAEFLKLKDRTKIFILDDTETFKNCYTKEYILNNPKTFNVLYNNTSERQGILVAESTK